MGVLGNWPTPLFVFAVAAPLIGLSKAHGLYQCVLLCVVAAQVVCGLVGFGVPPVANGCPARIACVDCCPLGVLIVDVPTVKGRPVCAMKVRSLFQPPIISSSHRGDLFIRARPRPKGSSYPPLNEKR